MSAMSGRGRAQLGSDRPETMTAPPKAPRLEPEAMPSQHRALVTAPFRGEGLDTLRELADVVLDPWIDYTPLRIYDGDKLAERLDESKADILIVESDFVSGPVYDFDLVAIGSCRGDPNNVDIPGATKAGIP